MKKGILIGVLLTLASVFFAGNLYVGLGAVVDGDFNVEPPVIYSTNIFGQVDFSIITAEAYLGYVDPETKEFYSYDTPDLYVGLNLKPTLGVFFGRLQVTVPVHELELLTDDTYAGPFFVKARLGLGVNLALFFIETGVEAFVDIPADPGYEPVPFYYAMLGLSF